MSESDDEATEEPCVHLGFLEPADPRLLLRHRFPSKLGGRPVCISTPPPRRAANPAWDGLTCDTR